MAVAVHPKVDFAGPKLMQFMSAVVNLSGDVVMGIILPSSYLLRSMTGQFGGAVRGHSLGGVHVPFRWCGLRLYGEECMAGIPCRPDGGADDICADHVRGRDNWIDTGVIVNP